MAPRRLAMQRGQYSGARRGTRGSGIVSPQREQFRYVMAGLEVEGAGRGRRGWGRAPAPPLADLTVRLGRKTRDGLAANAQAWFRHLGGLGDYAEAACHAPLGSAYTRALSYRRTDPGEPRPSWLNFPAAGPGTP